MRKNHLAGIVLLLTLALLTFSQGCISTEKNINVEKSCCKKADINFDNDYFYNEDGSFSKEAAKDAYIAVMEYHGYPVFDGMREKLWVSDYGTGEFAKLGLGAYNFVNNQEDGYLAQDMFLLPNQMLPEHYHLSTDNGPSKMEGWHIRNGLAYIYGEGEPTKNIKADIPQCHMNGTVTVRHETILHEGEFTKLDRKTARHWMFGGPQGAVISEYGTYHDNAGVRHSDPQLVFP